MKPPFVEPVLLAPDFQRAPTGLGRLAREAAREAMATYRAGGLPAGMFTLPPAVDVRVVWVEYPFPPGGGRELLPGEFRYLLYEGRTAGYWSDKPGVPCYAEDQMRRAGFVQEGRVVAFAAGVLLVIGDDQRVLTLDPKFCRVVPAHIESGGAP